MPIELRILGPTDGTCRTSGSRAVRRQPGSLEGLTRRPTVGTGLADASVATRPVPYCANDETRQLAVAATGDQSRRTITRSGAGRCEPSRSRAASRNDRPLRCSGQWSAEPLGRGDAAGRSGRGHSRRHGAPGERARPRRPSCTRLPMSGWGADSDCAVERAAWSRRTATGGRRSAAVLRGRCGRARAEGGAAAGSQTCPRDDGVVPATDAAHTTPMASLRIAASKPLSLTRPSVARPEGKGPTCGSQP